MSDPKQPTSQQWDKQLLKNPHAVEDKRSRVQRMFSAIAPSYDLNNRLHSLGLDQYWRRQAVRHATLAPGDQVVDVACGTGDLTLAMMRELGRKTGKADGVTGIDFTYAMLPLARGKAQKIAQKAPDAEKIAWINGDAMALPLPDGCANVVSIAFGIRNVADPAVALREFYRVLRPGGRVIVLEFSLARNPLLRGLYNFYFRRILPLSAGLISGDRTGAYRYLPESVNTFIGRDQMCAMLQGAGFVAVEQHPLSFGVCICYRGCKA